MSSNPVTEFLKHAAQTRVRGHLRQSADGDISIVSTHTRKVEEAAPDASEERRAREIKLWRDWKDSGEHVDKLRPLLKSFIPLIRSRANVYLGKVKMIPDSAIEVEFQLRAVDAFRSYDPTRGGSLGTYLYKYLDKAKRFVAEHQNVGRIPENRIYSIRRFTTARDDLTEELGSEPTVKQIAKRLQWTEPEVERMESEIRSDLTTQGFEDDPYALQPSKSEEVLRLFKYELEGDERTVYEYLTGSGREFVSSTRDIAGRMKLPDYQVSRLKNVIQSKLREFLEG